MLRTGVSHSDVSGRTWARVTGGCVPCPEARSVETRRPVTSVTSSQPQSVDTSQNSLPRPSPEMAETGERILQDTGRRMASMAVGSVAQATLGRLVGSTVASAVSGAVMQEINRREVVESL